MGNKHKKISQIVLFIAICFCMFIFAPIKTQNKPRVLGLQTGVLLRGLPESIPDTFDPKPIKDPDFSEIESESFIVFDRESGKVILEKNPHQKLQIASLTKLMTAELVLKHLDLNKSYEIDPKDKMAITPTVGFTVGDYITGQDLIMSMLIGSANDSALKLGQILEETNEVGIADQMNKEASELEMTESHFSNPMGFDDDQNYSTAGDLYKLVRENLKHGLFDLISRNKSYKFSSAKAVYSVKATNKLVSKDPNIFAVKTGNTPLASGTMVSRSQISGRDIVFIVLKSKNREQDTLKLRALVEESFNW